MMTATATSAATASVATVSDNITTSGLGDGLGSDRTIGPVSQKIAVFISNSLYVDFSPISAPKPNLIKIG